MGSRHESAFTARKILMTESDFRKYLSEQHSLPMRNQTDKKDDRAFSSAFTNTFKIFKMEAEDNHHLLKFSLEKGTLIREILTENSRRIKSKSTTFSETHITKTNRRRHRQGRSLFEHR